MFKRVHTEHLDTSTSEVTTLILVIHDDSSVHLATRFGSQGDAKVDGGQVGSRSNVAGFKKIQKVADIYYYKESPIFQEHLVKVKYHQFRNSPKHSIVAS